MKSILATVAFVFGLLTLTAQSDDLVKVLINKAQYDYLTTNISELQNSVIAVQSAYARADDHEISSTKSGIIKIVHQAPSLLSNFCFLALKTINDENAAGERNGLTYEEYVAELNQNGDYHEIELTIEEVETMNTLMKSVRIKKNKLKESSYAIHESQKASGSAENIEMLTELTYQMNEAIEILKIGKHR